MIIFTYLCNKLKYYSEEKVFLISALSIKSSSFASDKMSLRILLLALGLMAGLAKADLQCFVPGECIQSNLVSVESTQSAEMCLDLCKNTDNCQWFTYIAYASLCELLQDCPQLDESNCAECVSGEVACGAPKCDVQGICQVNPMWFWKSGPKK